jgi:hypothetical protein
MIRIIGLVDDVRDTLVEERVTKITTVLKNNLKDIEGDFEVDDYEIQWETEWFELWVDDKCMEITLDPDRNTVKIKANWISPRKIKLIEQQILEILG